MGNVFVSKKLITEICDSVRGAKNTTNNIKVDDIAGNISEIESNQLLCGVVDLSSLYTSESYTDPTVTKIGDGVFRETFSNIKRLSFPNCVSIGKYAMSGLTNVESIDLPSCVYIYSGAFENYDEEGVHFRSSVGNLKQFNIPNCVEIHAYGLPYSLFKPDTSFVVPASVKIMTKNSIELNAGSDGSKVVFDHPADATDLNFSDIFIEQGDSKYTCVANIYTDNAYIKDKSLTSVGEYTTVNVYHKDGTAW